jgi:hypothetical protein
LKNHKKIKNSTYSILEGGGKLGWESVVPKIHKKLFKKTVSKKGFFL